MKSPWEWWHDWPWLEIMPFSRKKVPLLQAVDLVKQAVMIAHMYKCDVTYKPATADLELFEILRETLLEGHTAVDAISLCMQQRFTGKPESEMPKREDIG